MDHIAPYHARVPIAKQTRGDVDGYDRRARLADDTCQHHEATFERVAQTRAKEAVNDKMVRCERGELGTVDNLDKSVIACGKKVALGLLAVARQRIALEVEQQYARIESGFEQQSSHHEGVGSVIARSGEYHHRRRRAPPAHNLTRHPLGYAAYKFLRAYALLLNGVTVNLAYIFCTKNLHIKAVFVGFALPHAKIQNNSDSHGKINNHFAMRR